MNLLKSGEPAGIFRSHLAGKPAYSSFRPEGNWPTSCKPGFSSFAAVVAFGLATGMFFPFPANVSLLDVCS